MKSAGTNLAKFMIMTSTVIDRFNPLFIVANIDNYSMTIPTRNWLQARLSVYPPQNYQRPITSFKSNMQKICQKYLFSIIILHENPPYV